MAQEEAIKLFDAKKIRVVWDDQTEKYYFSIIDIIQVLTESADATAREIPTFPRAFTANGPCELKVPVLSDAKRSEKATC